MYFNHLAVSDKTSIFAINLMAIKLTVIKLSVNILNYEVLRQNQRITNARKHRSTIYLNSLFHRYGRAQAYWQNRSAFALGKRAEVALSFCFTQQRSSTLHWP